MKIADFELERFFAKYEFSIKHNLSPSDCESFSIQEILNLENGSFSRFLETRLSYTESLGNHELRGEIAKIYNLKKESIITFAGAEEGIFILLNSLLNSGDEVIVQFPAYQALHEIAVSIGCKVNYWQQNPANNWFLDFTDLQNSISSKTKLIIINQPGNPTGYLMSKDEITKLADICNQNGIYLLCDEVYRFLEYDSSTTLPACVNLFERGISLGVMSKTFGLPGLRIGWLALNDVQLFDRLAAFKDYTTICNSAPSEFLSIIALKNKENIIKRNLEIICANLAIIKPFFEANKHIFDFTPPKAGTLVFPKITADFTASQLNDRLIKNKNTFLLPGKVFGFSDQYFRLGFGWKKFPEALEMLNEELKI